jgi:hypothetical protein
VSFDAIGFRCFGVNGSLQISQSAAGIVCWPVWPVLLSWREKIWIWFCSAPLGSSSAPALPLRWPRLRGCRRRRRPVRLMAASSPLPPPAWTWLGLHMPRPPGPSLRPQQGSLSAHLGCAWEVTVQAASSGSKQPS